jgi:uncharacterized protein
MTCLMSIDTSPQFVFKVSKYCNLRCDYCYEFPHLGDKSRMKLAEIEAAFRNIKSSIDDLAIEKADFIWHGGEPLLLPLAFYEGIDRIQKDVFGTELNYINSVQTNLTVLTDRHIGFLKAGFFKGIGVSFDVHGDQRIDTKGKSRAGTVHANIQKLIEHHIDFAAIAVLARNALPYIRHTYRFFDELAIEHRILAFYRSVSSEQAERHGLDFDELVGAYTDLFHGWLVSERATPVDPIRDYVRYAVRNIMGMGNHRYDRSINERVFIVDTNGDVFNVVESYEPRFCYGNLFSSGFLDIVSSDARARSVALSKKRVERFCHRCPYYGNCPGVFVANATTVEHKMLEERGCPVRAVIGRIVDVFKRTDLDELVSGLCKTAEGACTASHPALSIA